MPRRDAPTHLPPRVLAIVQAGGEGSRMDVLTRERAKPALPIAGTHHLIDIALSNLVNSGISDVWVSVQYMASSLDEHLRHGRPWDLDRNRGGYRTIKPERGPASGDGFATGNADDLVNMADHIRSHGPDLVVVLSCDSVFALDLRPVIAQHLQRHARATLVSTRVSRREARHKMVLDLDRGGVVRSVAYKPTDPQGTTVAAEVFVYDAAVLLEALDHLRRTRGARGEDLGDFGEHLVPHLVRGGQVFASDLASYWKDMGRPSAYLTCHRDLVRGRVDVFERPDWPMVTYVDTLAPARVRGGAMVDQSLLSPGCVVAGTVRGSVLGPGVIVEAGATVVDSVIFADTAVRSGAVVATSIIDEGVQVGRDARVGAEHRAALSDERVTLVGRQSQIAAGAIVEPGGRLEPGTIAD